MSRNITANFQKNEEKGENSQTINSLCERLLEFSKGWCHKQILLHFTVNRQYLGQVHCNAEGHKQK